MRHTEIPHTDSIQELAHFWDEHDVTDFFNELEEVHEPVFEKQNSVTIFLEPKESDAIQALAKSLKTTESDLIHEWVVERIHASSG